MRDGIEVIIQKQATEALPMLKLNADRSASAVYQDGRVEQMGPFGTHDRTAEVAVSLC